MHHSRSLFLLHCPIVGGVSHRPRATGRIKAVPHYLHSTHGTSVSTCIIGVDVFGERYTNERGDEDRAFKATASSSNEVPRTLI